MMKIYHISLLVFLVLFLGCEDSERAKELRLMEIELEIKERDARIEEKRNQRNQNNDAEVENTVSQTDLAEYSDAFERLNTGNPNLDAEILDDIQNLGIGEIASKWINTYDRLPNNYKNTVITSNGSYEMGYGDLYGLNKGFSSGLCDGYETKSVLFNYIADEYGATGGKTKQQEINGYRAGMVYHYLRSKVLKCQD